MHPFRYPVTRRDRRHAPAGYESYPSYLPFLRDEFDYRCAYCLKRETWFPDEIFSIDHLEKQSNAPDKICDYDNLAYVCQRCNGWRLAKNVNDPIRHPLGEHLQVDAESGMISALTDEGTILIRGLQLDRPEKNQMRANEIKALQALAKHDKAEWKRFMSYPEELPNLAKLRPPTNPKAEKGIAKSAFARREAGTLEEPYE